MPKQVPYEKKKIHIPTWVIREDQIVAIRRIASRDKRSQSFHIQGTLIGYIQSRTA
jgi:hypothetical protein